MGKWKKEEPSDYQGKKKDCKDHSLETKASKSSPEVPKKLLNFTPLVMHADKIQMQIKDKPNLKWPKAVKHVLEEARSKEILSFPQGSRPLHRRMS